jgi:hypothetical protein
LRRLRYRLAVWAILACQAVAVSCLAQNGGGGGAGQPGGLHMRGGSRNPNGNPSTTAPAPLKSQPDAWPRLDPGAMLCVSEDALKQYQEAVAAGTGPTPLPADCTRILERTPISILQRDGPSRVEVKSSVRTGWTDAWLPDKAPAP